MKIPKFIKIGGFIWSVEKEDNVTREGNCFGSSHMTTQKIYLDPNTTKQKNDQTFLHELLHAIWWQVGMGSDKKFNRDDEEKIIDAISHGLYQTLNDNKLLK